MNLPVKVTKYALKKAVSQLKGEKMKKKHAKSKLKPLKPVTFKGDPGRTYRLDEETVLSLLIETSKTDDFQAYDILVEDVSVGPTIKGAITQQDIFLNSALSNELFDYSDDEGEEEDEEPRPYDEYSQRASDEDSQSDSDEDSQSDSDEDSQDDLEIDDSDSALADLFNVSIDKYSKDLLATTSPARFLSADTVNNPAKTNADSKSARNAKPGELPPFSPMSWMPSPRDIAKKFKFSNIGEVEV